MKTIVFVCAALLSTCVAAAASPRETHYINTEVATQMVKDGKPDKDRLFVFYFTYLDSEHCGVQSITFNNLSCSSNAGSAFPRTRGFWTKPEFCNQAYCGDRFICTVQRVDGNRIELTVKVPVDVSGELTHRLLVDSGRVIDYTGQLSKYSNITRKLETASFVPIKSKSHLQFQDIDIGCTKMAVPAAISR